MTIYHRWYTIANLRYGDMLPVVINLQFKLRQSTIGDTKCSIRYGHRNYSRVNIKDDNPTGIMKRWIRNMILYDRWYTQVNLKYDNLPQLVHNGQFQTWHFITSETQCPISDIRLHYMWSTMVNLKFVLLVLNKTQFKSRQCTTNNVQ